MRHRPETRRGKHVERVLNPGQRRNTAGSLAGGSKTGSTCRLRFAYTPQACADAGALFHDGNFADAVSPLSVIAVEGQGDDRRARLVAHGQIHLILARS